MYVIPAKVGIHYLEQGANAKWRAKSSRRHSPGLGMRNRTLAVGRDTRVVAMDPRSKEYSPSRCSGGAGTKKSPIRSSVYIRSGQYVLSVLPSLIDAYSGAIGNTKASVGVTVTGEPVVALTGNVLTNNDTDEDATFPHTLSAVAETVSSTGGGTATINANGSFTFLPGVGDKNQNDAFTYNVTDGTATSSGTVTVGISNSLVWYVDNSKATNGDGRSSSPLNTLTGVGGSGASDGPNDILFLYQGSGNYTGGLPLEASQQLIGQPNGLSVNNGITNVALVPASGNRPTITNASGNGITLGTGNTIRSVNVGNASGSGILGNTFGTLDVGNVGVNTTGQALSLTTGTLSRSLSNVSSSGGTNN